MFQYTTEQNPPAVASTGEASLRNPTVPYDPVFNPVKSQPVRPGEISSFDFTPATGNGSGWF